MLVPGVSLSPAHTFQLRWITVVRRKEMDGWIQVIVSSRSGCTATRTALFTETD